MLGSACEIIILTSNDMREVIKGINEEYHEIEGCGYWFDPDLFYDLFWNYHDYGSNCYMNLDVSRYTLEKEKEWLAKETNEYRAWFLCIRIRALEYIRVRIPFSIDKIMVAITHY